MFIKWIHVKNYRNLKDVTIHFHPRINYFVGENAIGKSNFLDLLKILSTGDGFGESDFFDPLRPIQLHLVLRDESNGSPEEQDFMVEQTIQEIYPRLYACTNGGALREELPLQRLRLLLYLSHSGTDADLQTIPQETYRSLDQELVTMLPPDWQEGFVWPKGTTLLRETAGELDSEIYMLVPHLTMLLRKRGYSVKQEAPDNAKLIMMVALKVLVQIYRAYTSLAFNLQQSMRETPDGKRYLPVFISVDEPEIHLNPYLQRAVLDYYRQIISNENKEFLAVLKELFDIDGLMGQLFIVTHSTDALVDDYRHIIRFYRDGEGNVCSVSGVNFNFSKEVEKHLIMHFSEAKEALYARCVILVEGETEYGSFKTYGKTCGIHFDYYGICLINARGESSMGKLYGLLRRFNIPTLVLYDRDVIDKYSSAGNRSFFFTDEVCYEMDLVVHLLRRRRRRVLDEVVSELTGRGKGMVTKDMLRKGLLKLGMYRATVTPWALKNISDRRVDDLILYYFSWFYSNKGVVVGKQLAELLKAEDIPPAFVRVIERARELSVMNDDTHTGIAERDIIQK